MCANVARQEEDREDLLGQATAYVQRIEYVDRRTEQRWFVGFRAGGAVSVYRDAEPVYHFNASGQLRRAHLEGNLVKAERGRLVTLRRERSGGEVQLIRHEMNDAETAATLQRVAADLSRLAELLDQHQLDIAGRVPAGEPVDELVRGWLRQRKHPAIAQSPRVDR